jgi:hypothetical protein
MKVIFLQNTLFDGRRFVAGESADVPDAVAKKMFDALLAYAEKPIAAPADDQPVKAPVKRTTRKAVPK